MTKSTCQHGRWVSGRCECLIEHCSLMDLAQEEVYTFVFGPLNGKRPIRVPSQETVKILMVTVLEKNP